MDSKDIVILECLLQRLKARVTLSDVERTSLREKSALLYSYCLENRPTYIDDILAVKPNSTNKEFESAKFKNYLCMLLKAYYRR